MHIPKSNLKKLIPLTFIFAIIVIVTFVCLPFNHQKDIGTNTEYMIDVVVENNSSYTLDYLQLGIVLSETDSKLIDDLQSYQDNLFRFSVGYNQGTEFFFCYKFTEFDNEEVFFFMLDDMTSTEEPQTKRFEIDSNRKIREAE